MKVIVVWKKSESTVDFIAVSMHLAGYFKAYYCNLPFAHPTGHCLLSVFLALQPIVVVFSQPGSGL
jgi:hypothetical protein